MENDIKIYMTITGNNENKAKSELQSGAVVVKESQWEAFLKSNNMQQSDIEYTQGIYHSEKYYILRSL